MMKVCVLVTLSLLAVASTAGASYSGPYLFWGMDDLNKLKIPTLQGLKAF